MSSFGDDGDEMPRPGSFDDDAIDALLAGTARDGDAAGLASFIEELRTAAAAVPTPSLGLAAAIAQGGISTHQPQVAQWRKFRMKIKGFLAGLGIAGKVALGVGVAAAATTGAGAAGVLPGPVQHAVSNAVGAVTPFSLPDPQSHGSHDGNVAAGAEATTTTTTVADVTTTTAPSAKVGNGLVVSPTTVGEQHGNGDTSTTTIAPNVDGSGSGSGDGSGGSTTPTTEHSGGGDHNNPESLSIHCERSPDPARISCSWTASTDAAHARYVLLRVGDAHGRVLVDSPDALSFTDTTVSAGVTYGYRVDSLRADGSVAAHSPMVYVECCGGTTPTTEPHDTTTTIAAPHNGEGDGTTTTTTANEH
jgi:hypothetical protein